MLAAALALVSLLQAGPAAGGRREALLLSNCPRASGEYVGTITGRVTLHRELLGEDDVEAAIAHQLRYLWGHYRNDAGARATMAVTLSAEAPAIRVLSRREVAYGRRLALPYDSQDPRLKIDGNGYLARAVARGHVDRDDSALEVDYELRFKAAVCGRAQDPPARVRVPLPRDPWLAYWHVPREQHRPLRYRQSRAVTNPCADDDFADLPHPYYYWYDWSPKRHGRDDDGRRFDCRRWLRAGDDYDSFDVKLERVATASGDFGRLRHQLGEGGAPLTATMVVGVVSHAVTDLELPRWQALLGDGAAGVLPARAAEALTGWRDAGARDSGTGEYLALLEGLRGVMTVDRHATAIEDGNLLTEVTGRLTRSGRALRVRVALGLTDVFGPAPPRHWAVLRRALAEDQLVIYWGHAGIGENFRLAQIERNLGLASGRLAEELARSPLRLVAFLSCYSYMYFGQDLLGLAPARAGGAHFVFTAIEKPRRDAGPLAVLDLVDRVLEPANPTGRLPALPGLGADEFWLIKEVAPTAGPAAP